MRIFEIIHRRLEQVSLWAVWVGGAALLLAAFMVTIEVVGRKLGGTPITLWGPGAVLVDGLKECAAEAVCFTFPRFRVPGSDEYSGYVFAGATVWAYAFCLFNRSHIRIDALYNLFPKWFKAFFDIIALLLLGAYITYFTWKAWGVFLESWDRGSVSVTPQLTPLWMPQIVWVTGLTFFSISLIFLAIYTIVLLAVGQVTRIQQIAGTQSAQEEMHESTRGVKEIDS